MATDTAILREYLIALGFRVNEGEHKKFEGALGGIDKKAMLLGKTVVGVATSVVAMTTLFSKSMERLYYSSRYAGTTVSNMQAMEFGAQQIGLKAGQAGDALKNMNAALRSNPGLIGLLEGKFGIKVQGRDRGEVMLDLIAKLKTVPFYVAERFASLFGMDAETLFNMEEGLKEMKEAAQLRKDMAAEMGIDADKAGEVGKQYMNLWRQVVERAGLFGQALSLAAQGPMMDLMRGTDKMLTDWALIVKYASSGQESLKETAKKAVKSIADNQDVGTGSTTLVDILSGDLTNGKPYKAAGTDPLGRLAERYTKWRDRRDAKKRGGVAVDGTEATNKGVDDFTPLKADEGAGDTSPGGVDDFTPLDRKAPVDTEGMSREQVLDMFANLEKQYSLPLGILDRMWSKESNRGRKMFNEDSKAAGHFQFIPKTQKEYKLKDPYSLSQSADAAAEKMADLLRWSKGDVRKAAAGYNWGEGRMEDYALGKRAMPDETRDYMDAVAGPAPQITANPTINIYGVADAHEAGEAVAREQRAVNADLLRNSKTKLR